MSRTTARKAPPKNVEEQESTQQDYSKMTAVELKKLLDTRKIEGRSKLTKKETMIKVLELFDQNPDDKESIAALVAELSTPRKKNTSKSEVQEEGNESEEKPKNSRSKKESSDEEKPKRKPRAKKDTTESSSEEKSKEAKKETNNTEEGSAEEPATSVEKPKRKPRSKKDTTESSSEEKAPSEEEKPKRKPRSKKTSTESSSEDTPKKKSLSKKQKERDEELEKAGINRADFPPGTRFVKTKLGKFQVRYPKGYEESEENQPESSEKEVSSNQSIQEGEPVTETVEYDSDATQEIPEDEVLATAAKNAVKTSSKKPPSTKVPSTKKSEKQEIKEGKREVAEEKATEEKATEEKATEEKQQGNQQDNLEDDPSMKEVLTLTRDILKRMKYLAREANENQEFKKSWLKTLTQLKNDFDNELGLLGASIDE